MRRRALHFRIVGRCPLGIFVPHGLPMAHAVLVLCAALAQPTPAHAKMFISSEQMAFDEESTALLKDAVARLFLGRHGELIVPKTPYYGVAHMGCVNIIPKGNGAYDLAVFTYPHRYYYGIITSSCEIQYHTGKLPPGIDAEAFAGPAQWPDHDREGHPVFNAKSMAVSPLAPDYQLAKITVIANMASHPIPKAANTELRAVLYALADNAFYISKDATVQSPFALFLVEDKAAKRLDAVSPLNPAQPYFIVNDGGRTGSTIVFRRNAGGTDLCPEQNRPWPYFDVHDHPILPDVPFRMVVGDYLEESLQIPGSRFDVNGKPIPLRISPRP